MRIETDDRSFTLAIDRYEFPDEELGPTEDNPAEDFDRGRFLIITVRLSDQSRSWKVTGPYVDTEELVRLADWLDSIARGNPTEDGIYFIERDWEWTVDAGVSTLTLHLSSAFLPPTSLRGKTYAMPFSVDSIDLPSAVSSLRRQLLAFPSRPPLE